MDTFKTAGIVLLASALRLFMATSPASTLPLPLGACRCCSVKEKGERKFFAFTAASFLEFTRNTQGIEETHQAPMMPFRKAS